MRFWPMSTVIQSPLLDAPYVIELEQFNRKAPSQGAFHAAMKVIAYTQAVEAPHMVIVETEGAPNRRVYTQYPEFDEWLRLERGGVMQNDEGYVFMLLDALH